MYSRFELIANERWRTRRLRQSDGPSGLEPGAVHSRACLQDAPRTRTANALLLHPKLLLRPKRGGASTTGWYSVCPRKPAASRRCGGPHSDFRLSVRSLWSNLLSSTHVRNSARTCQEEVVTFDLVIHHLGVGRRGFLSCTSGLPQSNRRRYLDQCHGTRTALLQSRKLSVETGRSI